MTAKPKKLFHDPKEVADEVLGRALALMREMNIPTDVQVDRMTTFAAGAHVKLVGSALAARCFRDYANRIEQGLFAASEPTRGERH